MVDLPQGPRRGIDVRAPQSSVTSRDIVGPTVEQARAVENLVKAADNALTEVGAPLVQEAGTRAVTRAPDGTIEVNSVPMFGRLGEVYAKSTQAAYTVAFNAAAQKDLQDLAQKTMLPKEQGGGGGDPEWFRSEADAYVKRQAGNQRGGFQTYALDTGNEMAGQLYRNLSGQKFARDTKAVKDTFDNRLEMLQTDMANLAFQGGVGTPEYQKAWAEADAIRKEKLADPRFGYTQAAYENDTRAETESFKAEAIVGAARRSYEKDWNLQRAQQDATAALEPLALKPQEKLRYLGMINSHLATSHAVRSELLTELKAQSDSYQALLARNGETDPKKMDELEGQLRQYGAFAEATQLRAARETAAGATVIQNASPAEAAGTLRSIKGGGGGPGVGYGSINVTYDGPLDRASNPAAPSPQGMYQYLLSQGASQNEALMLTSAAASESGLNPYATHDGGKGLGLFGHNGSRLQNMVGMAGTASPGWQQQATFALKELRSRPEYQAVLAAKTPEELTRAQMAFEQPQGYTGSQPEAGHNFNGRLNTTRRFWQLTGMQAPAGTADTPLQSLARSQTIATLQTLYNDRASQLWDGMKSSWDKGYRPTEEQFKDLATLLPGVSDAKLREQITTRMDAEVAVQKVEEMPATMAQLNDVVKSVQAQAKEGADPSMAFFSQKLEKVVGERQQQLVEDPVGYGTAHLDKRAMPPVQPIQWDQPGGFSAALQERTKALGVVKAAEPSAGNSPFLKGETGELARRLPSMPADQAAQTVAAMAANLTGDQLRAAMQDKALKDAVLNLTKTRDPVKMGAGFGLLDKLDRDNPAAFKSEFGEATQKDVDAWTSKTAFLPPEDVAKEMQRRDDPAAAAARQTAEEAADKITKDWTPQDVVKLFDTQWFGSPGAPLTQEPGVANGALLAEYRKLFRDRYAVIGDEKAAAEKAKERMGQKWGVSAVGNRVMAHPPEKYVPAVDGKWTWVADQLDDFVRQRAGDQGNAGMAFGAAMPTQDQMTAQARYASPRAIVPDAKTEEDIAAGRPPSYQVVVQMPDGSLEMFASRFQPDVGLARAKQEADLLARRKGAMGTARGLAGAAAAAQSAEDTMGNALFGGQ